MPADHQEFVRGLAQRNQRWVDGNARWLIVTIAEPADVRPAGPADTDPGAAIRIWTVGEFTPLPHARVWRIDGR